MSIFFITSNKGKFAELQSLIPHLQMKELDLLEIQETDPKKIIQEKLNEAFKHTSGEIVLEDTSLSLEVLNGLPGPLIKWFLKNLGTDGLASLVTKLGNTKAEAKTIIAYAKSPTETHFFEGVRQGKIVKPRGENGFGWDAIFVPEGFDKTYAELSIEKKNQTSHRFFAASKLAEYLKISHE